MKVLVNPLVGTVRIKVSVPNADGIYEEVITKFDSGEIVEVTQDTFNSLKDLTSDLNDDNASRTALTASGFTFTTHQTRTSCCTYNTLRAKMFKEVK